MVGTSAIESLSLCAMRIHMIAKYEVLHLRTISLYTYVRKGKEAICK